MRLTKNQKENAYEFLEALIDFVSDRDGSPALSDVYEMLTNRDFDFMEYHSDLNDEIKSLKEFKATHEAHPLAEVPEPSNAYEEILLQNNIETYENQISFLEGVTNGPR